MSPETFIQYNSMVKVFTNFLNGPPVVAKLDAYSSHAQVDRRRKRCQRSSEAASDHERRHAPCSLDEQRDGQGNGPQYDGKEETSVLNPHSFYVPKVIPSLIIVAKKQ